MALVLFLLNKGNLAYFCERSLEYLFYGGKLM